MRTSFLPPSLRALAYTMMCCAAFHMAYLAVAAVLTGKWYLLSLVSIFDFNLLFPGIETSILWAIVGAIISLVLYGVWYVWAKRGFVL